MRSIRESSRSSNAKLNLEIALVLDELISRYDTLDELHLTHQDIYFLLSLALNPSGSAVAITMRWINHKDARIRQYALAIAAEGPTPPPSLSPLASCSPSLSPI